MADWVHYFNLAAASAGLAAALLGLVVTLSAPYVQRWERRYFCLMFLLLVLYIASDFVEQVAQYLLLPDFAWLARAGVFLELLFSVAIVLSFTAYLLRCANEELRTSPLLACAVVVYVAYVAVLVVAQFTNGIYYFSTEYKCVLPGPFGAALFIPPLLLMMLNLFGFMRRRSKLTPRRQIAYVICNVGPLVSMLVQAALFGVSVLVIGTSLSAVAMLGFILADQMDCHVRQREESALQHAQVMALQMRPHFIYNVMTSIYYLCAQDPARAQQVTRDFTDYMRANFDAIGEQGDVAFAKELEHTRAYLAVEQARLEDALVVEIDCPHTAFRLPPLTLQPLVENAVKHGADPELPPLQVRIATRDEGGVSVVCVEDSGPGFSEELPAGYPSSALANVRERLTARGAVLSISEREDGGTRATIRIPASA